ncbi:MAG: hypothetical protein WKF43_06985 [Acidimicrobiales bacterium]
MVAFVGSLIVAFAMLGAIVWYGGRRAPGAPLTWGEAMAGSTYVFFLMFWAYGVVPHQWLSWADNELGWRSDAYLVGPSATFLRDVPFNVSKQVIRDLVAVVIYGVFLGGHVALWAKWQARGRIAEAKQKAIAEQTTAYGRPLARRS